MCFRPKRVFNPKQYELDEATMGIGSNKVTFVPNYDDVQIAYKLWVELSTRKIGMEIDKENDVIVEVYNSWYDFFRLTREMMKDIPVNQIRKNESTRQIVRISINVLNTGLRPHLTQWQARFRKWFSSQLDLPVNQDKTPQEIQKLYPQYAELIEDMQAVNAKMIGYKMMVHDIAIGEDFRM